MTRPLGVTRGRKTGTREWSEHSFNCCLGCRHGCLYCYARAPALRFKRIKSGADWANERPVPIVLDRASRKYQGVVMFPTQHDISVGNTGLCLDVLVRLLWEENRVLVVSKAGWHVPLFLNLANRSAGHRGEAELRVSVTALDEEVSQFWEPGAPPPQERLAAIHDTAVAGIPTSVSIEPCLEPWRTAEIVAAVQKAGVTGEIWIGSANKLRARTAWCRGMAGLEDAISRLEAWQTRERMREVFESLKGNPQVRWKDSYQKALGIDAFGRP